MTKKTVGEWKAEMKWREGTDIDASIDRTIFELQAKNYEWTKTFSVRPRRCYWDRGIIRPFSYAMVATFRGENLSNHKAHPPRWVAMPTYIMLRLKGQL